MERFLFWGKFHNPRGIYKLISRILHIKYICKANDGKYCYIGGLYHVPKFAIPILDIIEFRYIRTTIKVIKVITVNHKYHMFTAYMYLSKKQFYSKGNRVILRGGYIHLI